MLNHNDVDSVSNLIERTSFDVVFGPKTETFHYAGNVTFRKIIAERVPKYTSCLTPLERSQVAKGIMEKIRSNGGRFLRKHQVDGSWIIMTEKLVLDKVAARIRDASRSRKKGKINISVLSNDNIRKQRYEGTITNKRLQCTITNEVYSLNNSPTQDDSLMLLSPYNNDPEVQGTNSRIHFSGMSVENEDDVSALKNLPTQDDSLLLLSPYNNDGEVQSANSSIPFSGMSVQNEDDVSKYLQVQDFAIHESENMKIRSNASFQNLLGTTEDSFSYDASITRSEQINNESLCSLHKKLSVAHDNVKCQMFGVAMEERGEYSLKKNLHVTKLSDFAFVPVTTQEKQSDLWNDMFDQDIKDTLGPMKGTTLPNFSFHHGSIERENLKRRQTTSFEMSMEEIGNIDLNFMTTCTAVEHVYNSHAEMPSEQCITFETVLNGELDEEEDLFHWNILWANTQSDTACPAMTITGFFENRADDSSVFEGDGNSTDTFFEAIEDALGPLSDEAWLIIE